MLRLGPDRAVSAPIALAPGASRSVSLFCPRRRLAAGRGRVQPDGNKLSLAEVGIPGVRVERSVVLPELRKIDQPQTVVLRAMSNPRTGCVVVDAAVRCVPGRDVAPEEPLGFRPDLHPSRECLLSKAPGEGPAGTGPRDAASAWSRPIGITSSTHGNPD